MIMTIMKYIQFILLSIQSEKRSNLERRLSEEKTQRRRNCLGNVQFIAELFKLRMVSDSIIHECIRRLLRSTLDETSLECVAILFTVAGKYLSKQSAKVRNSVGRQTCWTVGPIMRLPMSYSAIIICAIHP